MTYVYLFCAIISLCVHFSVLCLKVIQRFAFLQLVICVDLIFLYWSQLVYLHVSRTVDKKLSYRRGTARCVVSVEILSVATQQCRNYLYNKS